MPSRHELQTRRAMMWAIDNVWQLELFAKPLSNDALCSMVLVLDIRTGMDEKVPDAMAVIEKGKPVPLKDLLDELDRMQYPKRWARPQVEQICNNVRGFKGEKGLFMILATGDDPQRCGNMPEFNHTLWTAPMSSIVQMRATAAESIAETRRPPRAQSSSASRHSQGKPLHPRLPIRKEADPSPAYQNAWSAIKALLSVVARAARSPTVVLSINANIGRACTSRRVRCVRRCAGWRPAR